MAGWAYTLIFIFFLLHLGRSAFLFVTKLLSTDPDRYTLVKEELILLGIAISYTLTYLIY